MKQVILVSGGDAPSDQPAAVPIDVVVTMRVADAEEYRDGAQAAVLRGAPHIPNGRVVRGDADVNVGYSRHIDPASVEFVDTTTEV